MDGYEFSEVKGPHRRKNPVEHLWNVLTIFVLIATLCIGTAFVLIYLHPNSVLNPFPPPTLKLVVTTTRTVVPRVTLVPTWTATIDIIQPSVTPEPTEALPATPTMVATSTVAAPTSSGVRNNYAFVVQKGSPVAIDGAQFHPDAGCKWSGVAGQATSLNGEAVKGLFVQLGGSLPGVESLDNLTMTGLAPQYGQGGFEITLSDQLIASNDTMWIQLLDQQNLPLSNRVYFNTYNDCSKNLVIIYFDQVR